MQHAFLKAKRTPMSTPDNQPAVILIIDDNIKNLEVTVECLQGHGYETITARNGEMGLRRAVFSHPDLILLDVLMPGMDGFETCQRLKDNPATRDIPVIFMTVAAEIEDKIRGFAAGGVDYITKPVQVEEMLARVGTHVTIQRTREALRQSEACYRAVVEDQTDCICRFRLDTTLTFVNAACCRFFDQSAEALIGRSMLEFLLPEERQCARHHLSLFDKQTPVQSIEHRFVNGRGEMRWIQWTNRAIFDAADRVVEIQAVGRDITERVQAEEAYRTLVEHALQGLIILQDDRIVFANPATTDISGYRVSELLALSAAEVEGLLYPEDLSLVQQGKQARREEPAAPQRYEFRFIRKDGAVRWLECANTLIEYRGRPAVQMAYIDITERKHNDELLRRNNARLSRSAAELTLLNHMSNALQRTNAAHEAIEISLPFLRQLFAVRAGVLYSCLPDHPMLRPVAVWGQSEAFPPALAPETALQLARGQATTAGTWAERLVWVSSSETRAELCLGVQPLATEWKAESIEADRQHLRQLAEMVLDIFMLTLSNIQLREQLRQQAINDPLTGLHNRRFLDETLVLQFNESSGCAHTLSMMMVDVDHFKRINDTYGHEAGDFVLRALGRFLRSHIRQDDMAFRYGGEELLLLLPQITFGEAYKRAEELRMEIQQMQVEYNGQMLPSITVSIGVAGFPAHGTTPDVVIAAADSALYQAKAAGRNRVCVANAAQA